MPKANPYRLINYLAQLSPTFFRLWTSGVWAPCVVGHFALAEGCVMLAGGHAVLTGERACGGVCAHERNTPLHECDTPTHKHDTPTHKRDTSSRKCNTPSMHAWGVEIHVPGPVQGSPWTGTGPWTKGWEPLT